MKSLDYIQNSLNVAMSRYFLCLIGCGKVAMETDILEIFPLQS